MFCEGIGCKWRGVSLEGESCWRREVFRRDSGCCGSWFRMGVWEYWVGSKGGGGMICWEEYKECWREVCEGGVVKSFCSRRLGRVSVGGVFRWVFRWGWGRWWMCIWGSWEVWNR